AGKVKPGVSSSYDACKSRRRVPPLSEFDVETDRVAIVSGGWRRLRGIDFGAVAEALGGERIIDAGIVVGVRARSAFGVKHAPAVGRGGRLVDFIGEIVAAAVHAPDVALRMAAIVEADRIGGARAAADLDRPRDRRETPGERCASEVEVGRVDD